MRFPPHAPARRRLEGVAVHLLALLLALVILTPVVWLLISSVSSTADLTSLPLRWWPGTPDLSRYAALLSVAPGSPGAAFLLALRNSLLVALGATGLSLLVAIPAAYSFSRLPGRRAGLLYAVLATYMLPPVALVLPLYAVLARAGLLNSVYGLALVYCTILAPFATWLLKTNFDAVPLEIEESAQIDGLSRWGVLGRVTLPLALPGLSTAAVWAVLLAWDEFFYALLFTSTTSAKTLPVAIADFAAGRAVDYGLICAAGVVAALPPILIGFLLQRGLLSGLSAGAVKG
ncbi:carbohydrate ABC transporter permease [Deinococcus koreensis]|uniref:Carbohydrate ABC transporter permease n=1 Tax=Deinococcus koreensis TaxID=2054903 RepID=A0A2K3USZ5_9DEIO|nr:carbohydrate ABC transporter permease [Deinococcus koreensis]PNY79649.1 carbohydrate ABC transporter permease [Deinococcus koreensis]